MYDRNILEKNEVKYLAKYAIKSCDSKGRVFNEDEAEYRTAFQKDRDRILHTTAFRRLEYKTQVFINFEGDYYRTRLTHTLEVTQIGRTIARALGANEDLVESICLAHDLGHPPFGHSGEITLSKLMLDHGGFDHNKQSFRIVTQLEKRFPDFDGLNLTWEVLEGIVKHETEYDIADAGQFNPDLRGHLEAQITNVSDELAYTAHDLDDGLRSGIITPEMLSDLDLWQILTSSIEWDGIIMDELNRHRIIRKLIGMEVTDLVNTTSHQLKSKNIHSVLEVQTMPYNIVHFSEEMASRNRQLKDFLYNNLYRNYRVVRMAVKAENILSAIFNAYSTEPAMLPEQIRKEFDQKDKERVLCDYIAGMTDRYAIEEFAKLFDVNTLP